MSMGRVRVRVRRGWICAGKTCSPSILGTFVFCVFRIQVGHAQALQAYSCASRFNGPIQNESSKNRIQSQSQILSDWLTVANISENDPSPTFDGLSNFNGVPIQLSLPCFLVSSRTPTRLDDGR
ncbi:hypothetical protein EV361DRAFT_303159 [Lentinula raphanica]|nr:hypothetical protein EV361DRAFT_303159 [Lentinula raphanica]